MDQVTFKGPFQSDSVKTQRVKEGRIPSHCLCQWAAHRGSISAVFMSKTTTFSRPPCSTGEKQPQGSMQSHQDPGWSKSRPVSKARDALACRSEEQRWPWSNSSQKLFPILCSSCSAQRDLMGSPMFWEQEPF